MIYNICTYKQLLSNISRYMLYLDKNEKKFVCSHPHPHTVMIHLSIYYVIDPIKDFFVYTYC